MSSTRHSHDASEFNQERYASSPAYERGLLANLVARRCSLLDDPTDRELIWFLQYHSHQPGGLQKVAADLLTTWPERNTTRSMQSFGTKPGQVYTTEQCGAVRSEIALPSGSGMVDAFMDAAPESMEGFLSECRQEAKGLRDFLMELCLNPSDKRGEVYQLESCAPWYFPTLIQTLREYQRASAQAILSRTVLTEVGRLVFETLDYSLNGKSLTLIIGLERIGKSHAARAWCAMRPGRARIVEVPSTTDDVGFFRAIATALGISTGQFKAQDLRNRIDQVLKAGDLMLIFDEGHYLWPNNNTRGLPNRINWIMTALANKDIPVSIISTPQFYDSQRALKKRVAWRDGQFIGRIGHVQPLPERLSCEDLTAVAQSLLPGGGPHSIAGLVDYAQSSARYLAGISAVVKRAGFLANKAGREKILRADISQAITESVMPSDETLARALADRPRLNTRAKPARSNLLPIPPQEPPAIEVPVPAAAGRRSITPAPATAGRRSITPAPALDDTPHQMQPA